MPYAHYWPTAKGWAAASQIIAATYVVGNSGVVRHVGCSRITTNMWAWEPGSSIPTDRAHRQCLPGGLPT